MQLAILDTIVRGHTDKTIPYAANSIDVDLVFLSLDRLLCRPLPTQVTAQVSEIGT